MTKGPWDAPRQAARPGLGRRVAGPVRRFGGGGGGFAIAKRGAAGFDAAIKGD